jgi:hypothetical protein
MNRRMVSFPTKHVGGDEWLDMTAYGLAHDFCAERVDCCGDLALSGGPRVRHYTFENNVHWKLPKGFVVDISAVAIDENLGAPGRPTKARGKSRKSSSSSDFTL